MQAIDLPIDMVNNELHGSVEEAPPRRLSSVLDRCLFVRRVSHHVVTAHLPTISPEERH